MSLLSVGQISGENPLCDRKNLPAVVQTVKSANSKTVREIARDWGLAIRAGQKPPTMDLGNLLDDFRLRCHTPEEKMALVADSPESTGEPETDAYLAAMVESLCREVSKNPPVWTESSSTYLPRPWFAAGLESLKAILLAESPVSFRRRNLFVSANALHRV
jgi:hypothetical protein